MRRRIFMTLVLAMGLALAAALAAGVNFSGTWVLDRAKSDQPPQGRGGGPGPGGGGGMGGELTLMIKQSDNDLAITRKTPRGEQEQKFTLDGKENSNPAPFGRGGQATMKSKSKWNKDTLVIEGTTTVSGPNGEFEITSKSEYSLSADGKVLTISATRSTPQGDMTMKQVFNKQ